jgi:meiotic recombination protein REC8, fungi type
VGNARGDTHTLKENHDLILSASFDNSFKNEGFGGIAPSSSQFGGFGFDDDFLGGLDNVGVGDIGDELAQELGEGWGGAIPDVGYVYEPV